MKPNHTNIERIAETYRTWTLERLIALRQLRSKTYLRVGAANWTEAEADRSTAVQTVIREKEEAVASTVSWHNWTGILLEVEENGLDDSPQAVELAQFIVNNRLDQQLQGVWGRWCGALIREGLVTPRS